jgi:hypothetical protein
MKRQRAILWLGILLLLASPALAGAQAGPPAVPPPAAGAPAGDTGSGGTTAIIILVVAAIALIAGIAKAVDMRRKREEQTLELQSQIAEALLREPGIGVSVTPTVHIPTWKGSPARITLSGVAPNPRSRQAAMRIAAQEASRVRPDYELDDRMTEAAAAARTA